MAGDYFDPELSFSEDELSGSFDPGLKSISRNEYGIGGARINSVGLFAPGVGRVNLLRPGYRYYYSYSVDFSKDATDVAFGMAIKSITGLELVGASSRDVDRIRVVKAGTTKHVGFSFICNLTPGTYFTNAGVSALLPDFDRAHLHRILDVIAFRVDDPAERIAAAGGIVWVDAKFMQLASPIEADGA